MPRIFLSSFPVALSASFFAWRVEMAAAGRRPRPKHCWRLVLLVDFSVVFITRMIPHTFTWLGDVCFGSTEYCNHTTNPQSATAMWNIWKQQFTQPWFDPMQDQTNHLTIQCPANAFSCANANSTKLWGKGGYPMVYPSRYSLFKPCFSYIVIWWYAHLESSIPIVL